MTRAALAAAAAASAAQQPRKGGRAAPPSRADGERPAELFSVLGAVPTSGARGWDSFYLDGELFLTLASYRDGGAGSDAYNIDSHVYRWDAGRSALVQAQRIPTHGAHSLRPFRVGGGAALAVANYYNGTRHSIDSVVYRWDGAGFAEAQRVATHGACDWAPFAVGGASFLAVANRRRDDAGRGARDDGGYTTDSVIYRWDDARAAFVEAQRIPTSGATDLEHFTVQGDTFLAVANMYDGTTHDVDSVIYRWNGTGFGAVQRVPTSGARAWRHFTIGGEPFLAVANHRNDTSYAVDSVIYRWDGAALSEVQRIQTAGAAAWEHFTMGGGDYLAVANRFDGESYDIDSVVYQWDGARFGEVQRIRTAGAVDWLHFHSAGVSHLVVASERNATSYHMDSAIFRCEHPDAVVVPRSGTRHSVQAFIAVVSFLGAFFSFVTLQEVVRIRQRWSASARREETAALISAANRRHHLTCTCDVADEGGDVEGPQPRRRVVRFADEHPALPCGGPAPAPAAPAAEGPADQPVVVPTTPTLLP